MLGMRPSAPKALVDTDRRPALTDITVSTFDLLNVQVLSVGSLLEKNRSCGKVPVKGQLPIEGRRSQTESSLQEKKIKKQIKYRTE